jgi:xanthine dehydrogenase YagS FAD-binding subunit
VAAGLEMSGGAIQSAGLALGGVAPKPLRLFDVEAFLAGAEPRTEVFRQAAEIALRGAKPLKQNSFKLDLAKHSVVRALTLAAQ